MMFPVFTIANNMFAQQPATSHWFTLQSPFVINNNWQVSQEISYRTLGESIKLNQLFIRISNRYIINQKWHVALNTDYVHSKVRPYDKKDLEFGNEFRISQELGYRYTMKRSFIMSHRFRLEERFFGITTLNDDYRALRFRYRLGIIKNLSSKWDLQLTDEAFAQMLENQLSYNQNRVSFGGIFRYAANAHVEASYAFVKYSDRSQHVFSLAFQNRIILKSKKRINAG